MYIKNIITVRQNRKKIRFFQKLNIRNTFEKKNV